VGAFHGAEVKCLFNGNFVDFGGRPLNSDQNALSRT
jgi:hypothetical protein